jgi:acid phosphatase type 7
MRYPLLLFIFLAVCFESLSGQNILVYGDSRTNDDLHRKVVAAMIKCDPVAVFHTGDLVFNGCSLSQYENFLAITAELRKKAAFYPALGNHELCPGLFKDVFDLPGNEEYYTVDIDSIHFIVLNTNISMDTIAEQFYWLVDDLEKNKLPFTVAVFHHPPFSSARNKEDVKGLQDTIVPLLEQYGVQLVFNGHEHIYERSTCDHTVYVVTGGGGAPFYKHTQINECSQKFEQSLNFCKVRRQGNRLIIEALNEKSEVIDRFEINR